MADQPPFECIYRGCEANATHVIELQSWTVSARVCPEHFALYEFIALLGRATAGRGPNAEILKHMEQMIEVSWRTLDEIKLLRTTKFKLPPPGKAIVTNRLPAKKRKPHKIHEGRTTVRPKAQ